MERYEKIDYEDLEDIAIYGGGDDEREAKDRGAAISFAWLTEIFVPHTKKKPVCGDYH